MSENQKITDSTFSTQQKLEVIKALVERDNIRSAALKAFKVAYPHAPEKMISTAIFHVYTDGIHAALDWLVDVELFLQNPEHTLDHGVTYHLIYHLYNWLQFTAILPETNESLLEKILDVKAALEEDDREGAINILEELKERFDGDLYAPDF